MAASSIDPVAEGLVGSLSRPGGNITGVTAGVSPDMVGKQLELLKEVLGSASRVGVLWDIRGSPLQRDWDVALKEGASHLGVKIDQIEALAPPDLERAMSVLASRKPNAVYVTMGGATYVLRGQVAGLAARHRLPTIAYFRELPEAGGLMSYGPNIFELYRRAAWYVDRILRGTQPADLPVEQPTKFEFVINLKTAKALGLTVPQSVLLRADEVIQ
jgi:putative ABC transport system substrate-binding protein